MTQIEVAEELLRVALLSGKVELLHKDGELLINEADLRKWLEVNLPDLALDRHFR